MSADWKPDAFGYSLWSFEIGVRFPVAKLLEYAERAEELAQSESPFAIMVLAHLQALETRRDPLDRRAAKMTLVKSLYVRGWGGDDIRKLFRFIDWIMYLPEDLKSSFWQEFHEYEEEKRMPFVTSVERIGIEKGRKEMVIEAIGLDVELKFPDEAAEIMKRVAAIEDVNALRAALKAIKTIQTADEFCAVLARGSAPSKPA